MRLILIILWILAIIAFISIVIWGIIGIIKALKYPLKEKANLSDANTQANQNTNNLNDKIDVKLPSSNILDKRANK
jgi:hypothetical protein